MDDTAKDVSDRIAKVESDLSTIMQLLGELRGRRFAVQPQGIVVLESMVFAVSLEVTALASAVVGWADDYRDLIRSAKAFIKSVETEDATIRELVGTVRQTALMLTGSRSPQERGELLDMIRQALDAIEVRTVREGGQEQPATTASNVLPFRAPVSASTAGVAPEGGAA